MREIKFRAWNNEGKRWSTDWSLSEYTKILYLVEANYPYDNLIFEQFTGLLDKNGKEIFEGDILKDKYGTIGLCSWEPSCWNFINTSGCLESGSPWEIIGNIHENPELLA